MTDTLPIDTPGPYAQDILTRLGDREPMEVLESTPRVLRALFDGVAAAEYRREERPGKWSMLEVAHHLADGEMVVGFRIRMILAHDQPAITAYDQDLWSQKLHYRDAQLDDVLRQFDVMRAGTLRLARRSTDQELARYGVHSERGGESVRYTLRLLAGHDLTHLAQIARIKQNVQS